MKMKFLLLAVLALALAPARAKALSCSMKVFDTNSDGVKTQVSDGATVSDGDEIDAEADCAPSVGGDVLTYGWAPPMPFDQQSGAFLMPHPGADVGPVGVVEIGDCHPSNCDPATDPLCGCAATDPICACDPSTDPGCQTRKQGIALFDPAKNRDLSVYKRFKKLLVRNGRSGGDKICQQVANETLPHVLLFSVSGCEPNCSTLPEQADDGNPTNSLCPTDPSSGQDTVNPPADNQKQPCEGQPVNVATGAMWHQATDFSIPGRTSSTGITLTRSYLAVPSQALGIFGTHWATNFETRIEQAGGNNFNWIDEYGGPNLYTKNPDGSFTPPPGQYSKLTQFSDHFELRRPNGTVYFYGSIFGPYNGKIYQITDVHGESMQFAYDSNHRLTSVTSPFAGSISISYNRLSLATSVHRLRDNFTYTYSYDSKNRLNQVLDPIHGKTKYSYIDDKQTLATHGLLSSITDVAGRTISFSYDEKGRANNQYEPAGGVWTFKYGDHQTTVTRPNGGVEQHFFDTHLKETKHINPDGSIFYKTWTNGNLTDERQEYGGTSHWAYDTNGNLTSLRRPEDQTPRTVAYDSNFNKATLVQPQVGAPTQYTLDSSTGDITQMSRGGLSLQFTYDAFGNVLSTNNGKTTYSVQRDSNGLVTHSFDLHNPQSLTYDLRGRVTSRSYLSGRVLTYSYNDDDLVTEIDDNQGPTILSVYDPLKRLVQTAVRGTGPVQLTFFTYDDRDRLVQTQDALRRVTTFVYDKATVRDKPIQIVDPAGRITNFAYDSMDRLVSKTDPLGAVTKYSYDIRGNLTAVTDANGQSTLYSYDLNNRKTREQRPSAATSNGVTTAASRIDNYFYDASDHLLKEVINNQRTIDYSFDSLDRLTSRTVSTGGTVEDAATFDYENQLDALLLKEANNGVAMLSFSHENAPPFALSGYDVVGAGGVYSPVPGPYAIMRDVTGQIASVATPAGTIFSKSYDPAGRLIGVQAGSFSTSIVYDAFGRRSGISHSDGASGSFQYDLLNRLVAIAWSGPTPVSEQLAYDVAGNITQLQREIGAYAVSYDAADQMLSSNWTAANGGPNLLGYSSTYDLVGNRTNSSSTGSNQFVNNFLAQTSIGNPRADSAGFGDTVYGISGSGLIGFAYRGDDRVVSGATLNPDQTPSIAAHYFYDALGRRVAKQVAQNGQNFTQSYVHLGDEDRILLGKAGDGSVTTYVDGAGVDDHLLEVKAGVGKGFVTDHLGSVLNSEPAGSFHAYGPTGMVLTTVGLTSASDPAQYAFAGRSWDQETGTYYNRARNYNPFTSSWMSQDVIGLQGDDSNFYKYALNGPISLRDPSGLKCSAPDAGGYAGYATPDEAAVAAAEGVNPASIAANREIAGRIYQNPDGTFYVSDVAVLSPSGGVLPSNSDSATAAAVFHTHAAYDPNFDNENFSDKDIESANRRGVPSVLGTPSSAVKVYDPRERALWRER